MKRYIECESRSQLSLLPTSLDDFIDENNPVRVVEAFVDALDLHDLGFTGMVPSSTGRPGYHPSVMLKLYIYNYLNRIQSSRRLEKETHRNVELMWLLSRLTPDFKTIAIFRKDNGKAIRKVCSQFLMICRQMGLLSQAVVAVDCSKFKEVNNRDKNFTPGKVTRRIQELERGIDRYLSRLNRADQKPKEVAMVQTADLKGKIQSFNTQLKRIQQLKHEVQSSPDKQVSQTDTDARSLRSRGMGRVGYNVQAAVETHHHLIVAHEVTNKFSDRSLLYSISKQAKSAMGVGELEVIADRGFFKKEQIKSCYDAGIKASIPRTQTSNNYARGYFDRADFKYLPDTDEYLCPAGDRLIWRFNTKENGLVLRRYWSSKRQRCHLKSRCTPSKQRRVTRWEQEDILDEMQDRMDRHPDRMRIRRDTIEHTFGTLKS